MPTLDSQKNNKTFGAALKASAAYGNEFLTETPLGGQPYYGSWDIENILYPYSFILGQHIRNFVPTPAVNQEVHEVITIGWPDKKDPFTQGDLLDCEEDQVRELILRIRTLPSISYKERMANRLVTLFNDAKEEDSASLGIAVGSLQNFYNFFQLHTSLKCPTISLTPEYDIYVSWRVEKNRVFSVHFLPNEDACFVIFKPNDKHPERQIRISGTATTDILRETVVPHEVWHWILE